MVQSILLPLVSAVVAAVVAGQAFGLETKPTAVPPPDTPSSASRYPYDGVGRYAMDREDGNRGIQGLTELAGRFGEKPYRELLTAPYDGTWQTERVIFRDVGTGATVVRLTNDLWADTLSYFKGNWSADGQYIVFRRRPGMWENSTATHGPMVLRADGTGLRNVFRQYQSIREHVCSPVTPNLCFAMADGDKLVPCDLKTGVAMSPLERRGCWRLKISPDGKYLMGRSNVSDGRPGFWIVSTDGRERHEVSVPESVHDSYQFHPTDKKIMFWYEDHFGAEGFVQCDFDGKHMTRVPLQFDWNHGDVGPDRGAHTNGFITRTNADGWLPIEPLFARPGIEYYDDPSGYNGYLTWMPKSRLWAYATRIVGTPRLSEMQSFAINPAADGVVNRFRVCYTGLLRGNAVDSPDASPDGTKVLFNSNMLGRLNVYYVVTRLPEPPTGLTAEFVPGGVRLKWNPPSHHAEIVGYHVFRCTRSGAGFVSATNQPIAATQAFDRYPADGGTPFYAVSAVEHSGLESGLSEEATPSRSDRIQRRLFVEAESATCDAGFWKALDGNASDLHYLWLRRRKDGGRAKFTIHLPRGAGPWQAWARVKGEDGVQLTLSTNDGSASLTAPPTTRWKWLKCAGVLPAKPGPYEITLTSGLYATAVDAFFLTDDTAFSPVETRRIVWPAIPPISAPAAKAVSPYAVMLRWPSAGNIGLHHYNVYCSRQADAAPAQRHLVASPDRNAFYDWGLTPGRTVYYRVTGVDRGGNESPASTSVRVALPKLDRVLLERPPAETINFDVPRSETYVVWLKLKYGNGGGQYIALHMDRGPAATWTCVFDGITDNAWFTYDQWARFPLSAGHHQLSIENNTRHVVEAVLLTNDLSYRPEGHVNILSGW
ncbi:MAG: fibronectin type III domain-containing protein [Planctomycetaceae bacterium]|nr:fibronectin type III domain-containing protein [Planctomycetaceae bacterium]